MSDRLSNAPNVLRIVTELSHKQPDRNGFPFHELTAVDSAGAWTGHDLDELVASGELEVLKDEQDSALWRLAAADEQASAHAKPRRRPSALAERSS